MENSDDNTKSEGKCEICYQDLSRKRTVFLPCAHQLHRTCLINYCESKLYARCPLCDTILNGPTVIGDDTEPLPLILPYGPTGEPSLFIIGNPDPMNTCLDSIMINATEWLWQVAGHYRRARLSESAGEEFMQDIVDERTKVMNRLQALTKLQAERDALQKRLNDRKASFAPTRIDAKEAIAVAHHKTEDVPVDENDPNCLICMESLSRKRSVSLDNCAHKFHQSCAMKWFDERRPFHLNSFSCATCRAQSTKMIDEDGKDTFVVYPFESGVERLNKRGAGILSMININSTRIIKQFESLATKRRLALRDGKSVEWIADIGEEMEKLRLRTRALNDFRATVIENEEMDRIDRDASQSDEVVIVAEIRRGAGPPQRRVDQPLPTAAAPSPPILPTMVLHPTRSNTGGGGLVLVRGATVITRAAPTAEPSAAPRRIIFRGTPRGEAAVPPDATSQPPTADAAAANPDQSASAGPSTRAAARRRREAADEEAAAAAVTQKRRRR